MATEYKYKKTSYGLGTVIALLVLCSIFCPLFYVGAKEWIASRALKKEFSLLKEKGILQPVAFSFEKKLTSQAKPSGEWLDVINSLKGFNSELVHATPNPRTYRYGPLDKSTGWERSPSRDAYFASFSITRETLTELLDQAELNGIRNSPIPDYFPHSFDAGVVCNYLFADYYYAYFNDNTERAIENLRIVQRVQNLKSNPPLDGMARTAYFDAKTQDLAITNTLCLDNWSVDQLNEIQQLLRKNHNAPVPPNLHLYSELNRWGYYVPFPASSSWFQSPNLLPPTTRLKAIRHLKLSLFNGQSYSNDKEMWELDNQFTNDYYLRQTVLTYNFRTNVEPWEINVTNQVDTGIAIRKFKKEFQKWPENPADLLRHAPVAGVSSVDPIKLIVRDDIAYLYYVGFPGDTDRISTKSFLEFIQSTPPEKLPYFVWFR